MISTLKTVICKTKECVHEAKVLHTFDVINSRTTKGLVKYDRKTRYRCDAGHTTVVKSKVTSEDLKEARRKKLRSTRKPT